MRFFTVAVAITTVLAAAGCDRDPEPRASSNVPATASGGATGASPAGRAGEQVPLPPSPKGSASGEVKPDPGDANDHSSPQHDAKTKKNAD